MGFFDTLKRLAAGQPPFEVPPEGKDSRQDHTAPQGQTVAGNAARPIGPKVIPPVEIIRTTWHDNGPNMLITCDIRNESQGTVELDKIILLGRTLELDTFLQPNEQRQFNVYNGLRPLNMNYRTAELYFKDASGDYFCTDHNIDYEQEADGTYRIVLMHKLRTRDT